MRGGGRTTFNACRTPACDKEVESLFNSLDGHAVSKIDNRQCRSTVEHDRVVIDLEGDSLCLENLDNGLQLLGRNRDVRLGCAIGRHHERSISKGRLHRGLRAIRRSGYIKLGIQLGFRITNEPSALTSILPDEPACDKSTEAVPLALDPRKPMPRQRESPLGRPRQPASPRPDRRRFVEQSMLFLLSCQTRKLAMQRMIGRQKRLLAMQDRRVGALAVVVAIDLPRPQVHPDRSQQDRVRVIVEIGINQVRELARPPMDLDQSRSFDLAQKGPTAPLIHSQQRFESVQGALVVVVPRLCVTFDMPSTRLLRRGSW